MSKRRNTNRKWSNMLSTKYRNHQHVDDTAYQESSYRKRHIYEKSCSDKMQHSDTNFYTHMNYEALQDCISETNRDALKKLHMLFAEQEKSYSASEKEAQVTFNYDEVESDSTKFMPKPKTSRLTWFIGIGLATLGAVGIMVIVKR